MFLLPQWCSVRSGHCYKRPYSLFQREIGASGQFGGTGKHTAGPDSEEGGRKNSRGLALDIEPRLKNDPCVVVDCFLEFTHPALKRRPHHAATCNARGDVRRETEDSHFSCTVSPLCFWQLFSHFSSLFRLDRLNCSTFFQPFSPFRGFTSALTDSLVAVFIVSVGKVSLLCMCFSLRCVCDVFISLSYLFLLCISNLLVSPLLFHPLTLFAFQPIAPDASHRHLHVQPCSK